MTTTDESRIKRARRHPARYAHLRGPGPKVSWKMDVPTATVQMTRTSVPALCGYEATHVTTEENFLRGAGGMACPLCGIAMETEHHAGISYRA
jgi:hypothetical protein